MSDSSSLRIAMLHPQMGIGGAERLTLDAAIGLRKLGHRPIIVTRELPAERSFEAARDGSVDVKVVPTRIPLAIRGRLKAPLAVARMVSLARGLSGERRNYDVAYLDLVAHAVPALRSSLSRPVLFYCHYPDLLLTREKKGVYQAYRRPIDRLERRGLEAAAQVVVNSEFTRAVYQRTFPGLPPPRVVYPGVALSPERSAPSAARQEEIVLLSINRFVRAKNLPLAVQTLARLRSLLPADQAKKLRLILAGGFDETGSESRAVVEGIEEAAREAGVGDQVSIRRNPSDAERRGLLAACRCLVYTPENEHFGLGPIEAMEAGKPVVAANSGGPSETLADGRTGAVRPARADDFAEAIAPWIRDPAEAQAMGGMGRRVVEERFSLDRFARELEGILVELALDANSSR